jgi:3-dehydroquinate dehydratase II
MACDARHFVLARTMRRVIAVLNGVNLNLLGRRAPSHYGSASYQQLETQVYAWAKEHGLTARCFQTNHEGAFVEQIHDIAAWAQGLIVNPGAWTHYAYAIRDAIEFLDIPVVEVHISDVDSREEWRRHSVISDVVAHRIAGRGIEGYRDAILWLADSVRAAEHA